MVNIFSFCIYGKSPKYCFGLIRNLELIQKYYPDFQTYIVAGNDVPQAYIRKYEEFKNVTMKMYNETGGRLMSYRYFFIDDVDVECMFVRDADSRILERDRWCIDEFLKSNYSLFTIRDHRHHLSELMGGQSGMRKIPGLNVKEAYDNYIKTHEYVDDYNSDQNFIRDCIYEKYKKDVLVFTTATVYPYENLQIINYPRKDDFDFCGNVMLFKKDDDNNIVEYPEFSLTGKVN